MTPANGIHGDPATASAWSISNRMADAGAAGGISIRNTAVAASGFSMWSS